MTSPSLRYRLPQKAIKGDCPNCSPKYRRTLSRYIDTRSDEPLPELYGRCDREVNCGYHLSPYAKGPSGLSYADEVYQCWKEETQRQPAYHLTYLQSVSQNPPVSQPGKPVHSIPEDVFQQSIGHYERNQFARLLSRHFGAQVANQALTQFQIGTSSRWPGACVFWYIDEQNRKRGGQIKLFDDNWHTVKYVNAAGKKCIKTDWVHTSLAYRLAQKKQSYPAWLTAYIEQKEFSPCLFGLPQLVTVPKDKPIALVEAPKTAVICSLYFDQYVWLAVGALSYLNAERLAPLIGRSIIAFPDAALLGKDFKYGKAYLNWSRKAEQLRKADVDHPAFQIDVSNFLEQIVTDLGRQEGIDLADCLLADWQGYPPDWDKPIEPNAIPSLKITTLEKYLNYD
ncbi:DUF6371 domain-containing protein [Spirosoma sp. 48-14]|uniref:DUF6371 domain-containing protein n=1 Tax=Spirosoma sp. 48-14 TaxID=1895854 RepID=UPI00095D4F80|nr:DUF6371 domain-containing protein [Spirosoma sp. 48-14]OJW74280.1 MAG: hypothetical protein BGO59_14290 [Spirosoma sp. 48-14]